MSRWLVTTTLNSYCWASEMFSMLAETVHLGSKKGFWVEWHHHRCHVQKKKRIFLWLEETGLGFRTATLFIMCGWWRGTKKRGSCCFELCFWSWWNPLFFYQKREQLLILLMHILVGILCIIFWRRKNNAFVEMDGYRVSCEALQWSIFCVRLWEGRKRELRNFKLVYGALMLLVEE